MLKGITGCTMYLRYAAERIRILHTFFLLFAYFAAMQKTTNGCSCIHLPFVTADRMNFGMQWLQNTIKSIKRQCCNKVGHSQQPFRFFKNVHAISSHKLRAIYQCQPFFALQMQRLPPHFFQHIRRLSFLSIEINFAQPYQWKAKMTQRSQVATGT